MEKYHYQWLPTCSEFPSPLNDKTILISIGNREGSSTDERTLNWFCCDLQEKRIS